MEAAMFLGEPRRSELTRLAYTPYSTESFTVRSAGSSAPLGTLPCGTPSDIAEAVQRARAAQRAWAAMPAYFRLASLRRLPSLLDSHSSLVSAVLRGEAGLAPQVAYERVGEITDGCRRVVDHGLRALRPVKRRSWLRVRSVEYHAPLGLVGVVPSPATGFDPMTAVAALLAGNALLLVPEGAGSYGTLLLARFCQSARLLQDLVQVVPGLTGLADVAIGEVDHLVVSLTSERGQQLWRLAGERGIGVTVDGSPDPVEYTTLVGRG